VLLVLGLVYFIMSRRKKPPAQEVQAEKAELKEVLDTLEGKD
jgi:preprotein translocase subunit YajC